jgi:hypothetical protein
MRINELNRTFMPRWTEQARQRQRLLIREQQPWLHSTGARSEYGRFISSRNATKHKQRCPPNVTPALKTVLKCQPNVELQVGDRVEYIGTDPLIQTLVGGKTLVVVRLTPAIACATEDAALILEFEQEELWNAQMDT